VSARQSDRQCSNRIEADPVRITRYGGRDADGEWGNAKGPPRRAVRRTDSALAERFFFITHHGIRDADGEWGNVGGSPRWAVRKTDSAHAERFFLSRITGYGMRTGNGGTWRFPLAGPSARLTPRRRSDFFYHASQDTGDGMRTGNGGTRRVPLAGPSARPTPR
jgi:hypothetical protein